MQRSALCRSRQNFSNEYFLAKFGFDTAENEPFQVCPLSAYRSPRCTKALIDKGNHFVICGVRDVAKMDKAAKELGIPKDAYLPLRLELGSLESVKNFAMFILTPDKDRFYPNFLILS